VQRGSVVTVAGGGDFSGKPRPAIVVQSDLFDATTSVTLCLLTSTEVPAPLFRIGLQPDSGNGLGATSFAMADKLVTVRRDRVGQQLGQLAPTDMERLDRALLVFLGLAS
jgi:mRNA interferase MazF